MRDDVFVGTFAAVLLATVFGLIIGRACAPRPDPTLVECVSRLEHVTRFAVNVTENLVRCSEGYVTDAGTP